MATWLQESTAVEVKVGPFVSTSDGFTPVTSLTIAQADVRLAKNDADWAQKGEATSAVHEENGWYRVLLNTSDTNACGTLILAVNKSGALPVWREFMVVSGPVYEAQILGNIQLDVRVVEINQQAARDISDEVWDEPIGDHTASNSTAFALDAIGDKTASLTFTVAGQVDANIQSVNDTTVTGSGTGGSPWGP